MSEPPAYSKTDTVQPSPDTSPIQPRDSTFPNQPTSHQPYQQPMGQPVVQQPMQHNSTTVVVMGQQQPVVQQPLRDWSTGLCGCFEDPLMCLCVMCCLDNYGCLLASKAGEASCLPCCVPGWLISLRAHTRGKFRIAGSICNDCCTVTCCYPCAMCQLSRELDNINKGTAPR